MRGQHAVPPGPAGTCSGRDVGNHQPDRCVTRATMPLAARRPAASTPEGRALRRQGASAWRVGGIEDLPRRPAQIPRASLGCRAGLSKAERPGLELRTMKLLSQHAALRKASVEVGSGDGVENSFSTGDPPSQNIVLTTGSGTEKWLKFFYSTSR